MFVLTTPTFFTFDNDSTVVLMISRVSFWRSISVANVACPRSGVLNAPAKRCTRPLSHPARRPFTSDTSASSIEPAEKDGTVSHEQSPAKPTHLPLASVLTVPNPLHSSLSTFLEHAHRVRLTPTTQVFLGSRYEYLTQEKLASYGFELLRTGKAGDRGVDLAGYWHLPDPGHAEDAGITQTLRVLVQCKRLKGKRGLQPSAVRELEGAFLGAPTGWRSEHVLGVMVSTKPATKGVVTALSASKRGLIWICMEEREIDSAESTESGVQRQETQGSEVLGEDEVHAEHSDQIYDEVIEEPAPIRSVTGRVVQMLYNHAARGRGLEGLDVIRKHNVDQASDNTHEEVTLSYRGHAVQAVDSGTKGSEG